MPKARKQTAKVLYLYDILRTQTDEAHPMSADRLVEELQRNGISAERKSVYDDIAALRAYGLDVAQINGRGGGYFVAEREFEDVELQLLAGAVQASRFITERKSQQLIAKLGRLTSRYAAQQLRAPMVVPRRVKSMNESIYYSVFTINEAIRQDTQITFRYFSYNIEKKKQYRHQNRLYQVSPYALIWNSENYYLVAYDGESQSIRHYRVDKMDSLNRIPDPRTGQEAFRQTDMSAYTRGMFHMFRGRAERVRLRLPNPLIGVVMDEFGRDVAVLREDSEHFSVWLSVEVSPQFYGWVFGLGPEAEIMEPARVRSEYRRLLTEAAARNARV